MNRILAGLVTTTALIASAADAAAPCGCKDLPAMIKELNEQQFLQQLFTKWADYMPSEIVTTGDLVDHATTEFNNAFYSHKGRAVAGTANGGHAAFGTDLESATCPIVRYLYDGKGNAKKNPDGTQMTEPVTEDTLQTKECDSLVKFAFAHERSHQATCLKLVAEKDTWSWKNPVFFAHDDAKAYQAGIDVLREETKALAGKCGWNNSTKNRLPDLAEAKSLAKRAAKALSTRKGK
jgi:hypothetical protein